MFSAPFEGLFSFSISPARSSENHRLKYRYAGDYALSPLQKKNNYKEISVMFFTLENHVRLAVAKAGGPTYVSNQLLISNGAVHAWIQKGRVANLDYARKLSELSGVAVDLLRPVS